MNKPVTSSNSEPTRSDLARLDALRDEDIAHDPDNPPLTDDELQADDWFAAGDAQELDRQLQQRAG